jgi:hypothetical protein
MGSCQYIETNQSHFNFSTESISIFIQFDFRNFAINFLHIFLVRSRGFQCCLAPWALLFSVACAWDKIKIIFLLIMLQHIKLNFLWFSALKKRDLIRCEGFLLNFREVGTRFSLLFFFFCALLILEKKGKWENGAPSFKIFPLYIFVAKFKV